ncbi:MAG: hypothetical protein ACHP83_04100 [Burkholderiales bacterium]
MSKHQIPDTGQLQHMNVLLEAALELPEDERDAWLDALPPQHRALTPSLRVLLQRATEETDGFMRRSVGWLRWPQRGHADALQLAERALAMAEIRRGDAPHSASSGEAWLAVARARHAAGDAAAARDACARALRHLAATVDDWHPSLADARALAAMLG